jgi:hypothetical protein
MTSSKDYHPHPILHSLHETDGEQTTIDESELEGWGPPL